MRRIISLAVDSIQHAHRTTQTDGTGQLPDPQEAVEPVANAPAEEPTAAVVVVPEGNQPEEHGRADPPRIEDDGLADPPRNEGEDNNENAAQDEPAAPETQDPPETPEEQCPPVGEGVVDRNAPYWIVTRIVSKLIWRSRPAANIMAGGQ